MPGKPGTPELSLIIRLIQYFVVYMETSAKGQKHRKNQQDKYRAVKFGGVILDKSVNPPNLSPGKLA